MDLNNSIIRLCIAGTQAEFRRDMDAACALYAQAWDERTNDYEASIAAHYVARCQNNPVDALRWDQDALAYAKACNPEQVAEFMPSFYLSLGHSHEVTGELDQAQRYYALAAELGIVHQDWTAQENAGGVNTQVE